MEKKTDRRIIRTKTAIREAFFALIEEMPADKISVRELCERANINRSSFYDHYLDYPDFLESIEREFAQKMFEQYDGLFTREHNASEIMKKYLHLIRHSRETRLLFSEAGGRSAVRIFEETLKEPTITAWRQESGISQMHAEYLFRYINSGGFAVIQQWYESGFSQPEEEIQEILTKMITSGVYAFIYPYMSHTSHGN